MPPKNKKDNKEDDKPNKINYDEVIRSNLSEIKFSPDRQSFGYTQLKLNGKYQERPLETITSAFGNYRFLKNIDISYNSVSDIGYFANQPNLIVLNAARNNIASIKCFNKEAPEGEEIEYWKSLQYCYLNGNKIAELGPIRVPNLIQ